MAENVGTVFHIHKLWYTRDKKTKKSLAFKEGKNLYLELQ